MQEKTRDDVIEIDLRELFQLLLHWLWLIAVCGAVTAAIGFILSAFILSPQYESTTKVYILNKQESGAVTISDTQLATQLTKDYNELINSRFVLERVIEECALEYNYEGLMNRVTIENKTDTRIIGITVKDEDPAAAQLIADTIRDEAAEHITTVMDIEAVNIVEPANLPLEPSEPSILRWTAIGMLLGIFLCGAVIVIRFLLDDTLKSAEDIENHLGLSTLALIPDTTIEHKRRKKGKSQSGDRNKISVGRSEKVKSAEDGKPTLKAGGRAEEIKIEEITDI